MKNGCYEVISINIRNVRYLSFFNIKFCNDLLLKINKMQKYSVVNEQRNIFEFKIKYQEPISLTAPKKGKVRYSLLGDNGVIKNYLLRDKNKNGMKSEQKDYERQGSILHSERERKR